MNTKSFKAMVEKVLSAHPSLECEIFAHELIVEVLKAAQGAPETVEPPAALPIKERKPRRESEKRYEFSCIACGKQQPGFRSQTLCTEADNPDCKRRYKRAHMYLRTHAIEITTEALQKEIREPSVRAYAPRQRTGHPLARTVHFTCSICGKERMGIKNQEVCSRTDDPACYNERQRRAYTERYIPVAQRIAPSTDDVEAEIGR